MQPTLPEVAMGHARAAGQRGMHGAEVRSQRAPGVRADVEALRSIEQLRERMPALRQREQALRA
jgi:hypothetical protein